MAEPDDPRWLTERDVVELLDLPSAIDAVSAYLALEAAGEAITMEKTHVAWDGGHTLHALGGVAPGALAGAKTWAHTGGGATPLLLLWDAGDGRLRAVIEAFALGQLRTASMSGVATRWSARPDATTMAIIGTGKQALAQVAAVAAVRPIRDLARLQPDGRTPRPLRGAGGGCRSRRAGEAGVVGGRCGRRRRRDHHGDPGDRAVPLQRRREPGHARQRRRRHHPRAARAGARACSNGAA